LKRPDISDVVGWSSDDVGMIDWPNLIAGAVLGFLLGFILWMIDRHRARRQRVLDASTAWMSAAKEIELVSRPDASASDIYKVRVKYPVDLWRSILGPSDFVVLERLEGSYQEVEGMVRLLEMSGDDKDRELLEAALIQRRDAFVEFANLSRRMQSVSYTAVANREEATRLRRDYLRHPLRTITRERRNRKARRAHRD